MTERILPRIIRDIGEQLRNPPACHTLGISATSGWVITRLHGGGLAVGSFGGSPPSAEEVTRAIADHATMDSLPGFKCVGL